MAEYKKMEHKYLEEILALAAAEYYEECSKCIQLMRKDFKKEIENIILRLQENKYGKVAVENGDVVGYLLFEGPWNGFFGNVKGVFSPLGGSAFAGKNRNMIASKLFQATGTDLAADNVCSIGISRYAHDDEVGRSFIMNGFGIRCSDGIMRLSNRKPICKLDNCYTFEELSGERKKLIWELRKGLVEHLYKAPVFYPSDISQFSQWFEKEDIRVIVIKEGNQIIGFMSFCAGGETFVTESRDMYSICGAYLKKECRGKGTAQQLLEYVIRIAEQDGMKYLGVDCETMNPTALRFWGKYFDNYTYSYVRRIDERVVGYDEYFKMEMCKGIC